jgi:hypothetical protein
MLPKGLNVGFRLYRLKAARCLPGHRQHLPMINSLAVEALESGRERSNDEAVENWEPEFEAEATFA